MAFTKKIITLLFSATLLSFSTFQCISTENEKEQTKKIPHSSHVGKENDVLGFGILKRIPGQWNGPVSSTTPAGNFDNWYVDFRPVSPAQVSQYSTLDQDTINYISFFIVKHDNQLKVAMRTEGVFRQKGCVTYEVIDKVKEDEGYYRFSDFRAGTNRAYSEFVFTKDSFTMKVYTNKFNTKDPLELHSQWDATLGNSKAAEGAISHFDYPQPIMIKDFSAVFNNMSESIYFTFEHDPYNSLAQPYVGKVTVHISIDKNLKIKKNHELFLLLTTESLFDGLKYKEENLDYISKYVYLPAKIKSYTFHNVHPGDYFLYSFIDIHNDKKHLKGDYMSSDTENRFTLSESGSIAVNTIIDFIIP